MIQTSFAQQKRWSDFFKSPWLVIIAGLIVQVGVIVMLLVSIQQPAQPDVTLAAVAGNLRAGKPDSSGANPPGGFTNSL